MSYPKDSNDNQYVPAGVYLEDANGDEFYPQTNDGKLLIMATAADSPQFITKITGVSFVNLAERIQINSDKYFTAEQGKVGALYVKVMTNHDKSPYDSLYDQWRTDGMKNEPFETFRQIESWTVYFRSGPKVHFVFYRDREVYVDFITPDFMRFFIWNPDKTFVDINYNYQLVTYEMDANNRKRYINDQGQQLLTATASYTLPGGNIIDVAGSTFNLTSDQFWQDMDPNGHIVCYDEDGRFFNYSPAAGIRYFNFSFRWKTKYYYNPTTGLYITATPPDDEPLNIGPYTNYTRDSGGSEIYPTHKGRQFCLPNREYARNAKGDRYYPQMADGTQMVLVDDVTGDPVLIPGTNPDLTTIVMNYPDATYRLVKLIAKPTSYYYYYFLVVAVIAGMMIAVYRSRR